MPNLSTKYNWDMWEYVMKKKNKKFRRDEAVRRLNGDKFEVHCLLCKPEDFVSDLHGLGMLGMHLSQVTKPKNNIANDVCFQNSPFS